jgi:hypothetical protein
MKFGWHIFYVIVIGGILLYFTKIADTYNPKNNVVIKKHEIDTVINNHQPVLVKVDSTAASNQIQPKVVFKNKYIEKWYTKIFHDTLKLTTPVKIDTSEVVKLYYSKYYFSDTLTNGDTTNRVKVILNDVVTQNKIVNRSALFNYQFTTKDVTKVYTQNPRTELYIGPNIGEGVGISAALKTKSNHLYDAGYMFNLHGSLFYISAKWKISLR